MGLKKRSKVSATFNMSSLTDIIFLLLIFFMLTSSLVSPNALNLQLPGKRAATSTSPSNTNTIRIDRAGIYYYNDSRINITSIAKELKSLKDANKNASIIIRTSPRASVDHVVAIMDLAWKYQLTAVVDETD